MGYVIERIVEMSDTLPPGRELDTELHVKVFGGCLHPMPWDKEVIEDDNDYESILTCRACGRQHPNYSTSWDAMRLVVERLVALGFRYEMGSVSTGQSYCVFALQVTDDSWHVNELGDTLPHAVALAALKAAEADHA